MTKKNIFLDIDKTILNVFYEMTDQSLPKQIRTMIAKGWQIGLNSDSPNTRIQRVAQEIGTNGLIIAEKGNAIYHPTNKSPAWDRYIIKNTFSYILPSFIQGIREELEYLKNQFPYISIVLEDPYYGLHVLRHHPANINAGWCIMIHIDRKYSISLFVKHFLTSGGCIYDESCENLLSTLVSHIRSVSTEHNYSTIVTETSEEYGNMLVHDRSSHKALAIDQILTTEAYEIDQIFMIGDSISDFLDRDQVVQLGVGNSTDQYKEKCTFVAKSDISTGANECLKWIDENFTPE